MKHILVCIKAVPAAASVRVDGEYRLKRDGTTLQWNIADEAALEAALRLKDRDGTVTVVSMGPSQLEAPLKELMARGADRAVLITDGCMAGADTRATAAVLKAAAEKLGPFDLILCGRRAIDGETGQVPGQLAAALGLACVSNVEALSRETDGLTLQRRLEDGVQALHARTPLVVSICEYALHLRLPGILSLRKAKDKAVELYDAAFLGLRPEECGQAGSLTRVTAMEARFPGLRKGTREQDPATGAGQILRMLREVRL